MSVADSDIDVLRGKGGIPTSPFEIQITKEAIQRRLDNGDITREDIEILKRSYRWMTISSFVGWMSGIPVFFLSKRRVPPPPLVMRIFASTLVGMTGGFMGFTAGGAAAAMEVNKKMPDATRKLKVFQEIVIDSRRAIEEHRRGIPDGTVIEHRAGIPEQNKYIPPRESGASDTSDASASSSPSPSFSSDSAPEGPMAKEINAATGSTWDRLRTTRPPPPKALSPPKETNPEDDLRRQQAEFDAMLERERRGGDDLDKWK